MQNTTDIEFNDILNDCQQLFQNKLKDYGTAWRIMRPSSITDQLYIKISRIRKLQTSHKQMVDDDIPSEFVALVNYSIIGLIQLEMGFSDNLDSDESNINEKYKNYRELAIALMQRKNHDYGEAWREMRVESISDLILQKVLRTKQIEDNCGKTLVSEGIDANYYDILIYAVFCLIRLKKSTL